MKNIDLNEEFFRNVKKEVEQYVNDYEYMQERRAIIEQQVLKRHIEAEESYAILERFGII